MSKHNHNFDSWENLLDSLVDVCKRYFYLGAVGETERLLIQSENILMSDFCPDEIKASFYAFYSYVAVNCIFFTNFNFNKALDIISRGESYSRKIKDDFILTRLLAYKGTALYYAQIPNETPNYLKAKDFLHEALTKCQKNSYDELFCEILFTMALIEEQTGNKTEALAKYEKIYSVAKKNNFSLPLSESARHIGFAYFLKNDFSHALEYFIESHAIRETLGYNIGSIFSHITLGDSYLALKRFDKAEHELLKAYSYAKKYTIKRGVMISGLSLGELYIALKDHYKAKTYLEEVKLLEKEINYPIVAKMVNQYLSELE